MLTLILVVGTLAGVLTAAVATAMADTLIGQVVLVAIAAVAALTLAGAAGLRHTIRTIRGEIFMSQQETIDAITGQLGKAAEEIIARLNELAAKYPELDLTALRAAAQRLDDIVPDAEEPVDPDFGAGGSGAVVLPDDVPVPE